ncbi:MAG: hypothetical protein JJLCMIEE_01037 [Acidimicrobiales bacterium]|nr:MAG: hypothetical protein EDR02_07610 [Actinomycetota bacterium]MBV6507979.1 hypothetical protein [Acidimicrobiales bacterium]RIK06950.1 MAG: hypothetical protein DCC48_05550 [Acidobacteriota bacterium]
MRFLTAEWVDALDAALDAAHDVAEATRGIELVVQQEIHFAPEGDSAFHMSFQRGRVSARHGRHAEPDICFSQDYDTAVAIATGRLSAQTAFLQHRLRVQGDVVRLLEYQGALARVADVFAQLRENTEY